MAITPDTKDWTWVVERPCEECGFDAAGLEPADVAALVRSNAEVWPAVLSRPDARVRPDDATWSPLEYAAHVRDVLRLYDYRLHLMLAEDDPVYPNWDQDAAAVAERYNEQDPAAVADDLAEAAGTIAADFASLDDAQWQRTGRRSDGAAFTVTTFARYFAHDLEHHRVDVGA